MTPRNALAGALLIAAVSSCGGAGVTPAMVSAAQKRWPDASEESLERGRALFTSKCKDCHALPSPKDHSAEEWPKYLEKMSKLAGLDAAGKESVLRYVISARDAE